jgi:uncharacterized protein YggE
MRPLITPLLAMGLALAAPAAAQDMPRRITVTGMARVEAVPDLATVSVGVTTRAATAAAALAANSEAMAAVMAGLDGAGIAAPDRQTSQLNLSPVYAEPRDGGDGEPEVTSFQADNTVTVRVRDIARLGETIDALTTAGANRLYGIGFEVSEPREALDGARREAVADARARAELFAEAAGVRLGPVISLSEGGGGGPMPMYARAEAAAAPVPIAEGTVTLTAEVEVVYGIE